MDRESYTEPLAQVAAALAISLIVAPVVRSVTADLNDSVGQTWPFSLAHCHAHTTPGCDGTGPGGPASLRHLAVR